MKKLIPILIAICFCACSPSRFNSRWTSEKSPEIFTATFETLKGNFDIEVTRSLSPQAADRTFQLIKHHYFENVLFYRVVPGFVAQFGSIDTTIINRWEHYKITDDPVLKSNLKGTLSFARAGKDSRGSQLYINLKDNLKLDTLNYADVSGFPVFGVVTKGMDVVESLYSGYGDSVFDNFDSLTANRQKFLNSYPKLDLIKKASIIKTNNR